MKVAVIGIGYVGLTVVGAAANSGHEVYAYDLSDAKIHKTQEMIMSDNHMTDGYLLYTIRENMQLVHFSNSYDENLKIANVKFVCVDTINVPSAIQMLTPFINPDDIIIVESTIEVKTCKIVLDLLKLGTGMTPDKEFIVAFVPERVMEGRLLENFIEMPRAIGTKKSSFRIVKKIYESLGVMSDLSWCKPKEAIASKIFENAFRFIEISIANEFADICRESGLDYSSIRKLINSKGHYLGCNEIMNSGIGIGGPCVPMAADMAANMDWKNSQLLRTAIELNMGRPHSIARAIVAILTERLGPLEDKMIAILGATYRPNGVDNRDSPAIEVLTNLANEMPNIHIYDPLWPNGSEMVQKLNPEEIEDEFDSVVILVGHWRFKDLSMMKCMHFLDLTGVVEKYPEKAQHQRLRV